MQIILASSSIYRKALLERLPILFNTAKPEIDETPSKGENPRQLATRLALEKARCIANKQADSLVIGSDQVAVVEGKIVGKPGNRENATQQLLRASGKSVEFLTGLCLYNSQNDTYQVDTIPFKVFFRELSKSEIEKYVDIEQPFDCAGSFKWEKLGIALFKKMEGDDVTALEGLPLIRLIDMLKQAGQPIL